jgi:hypothetical protein
VSAPGGAAGLGAAVSIAAHLGVMAEGWESAASALPDGAPGWTGLGANQLGALLAAHPGQFRVVAGACREASAVLFGHAERLAEATALWRAAESAPVEVAAGLRLRASALEQESARAVAQRLTGLAAAAPRRAGRVGRFFDRLGTWRGEVLVGAGEATGALTGGVIRVGRVLDHPIDQHTVDELESAGAGLVRAARHPLGPLKALIDWDTWRSNPARAVGHLLPDLVGAGVGGVTAKGLTARLAARREALAGATYEQAVARVTHLKTRAAEANSNLLAESLRATENRPSPRSSEAGDLGLTGSQAAAARRHYELSVRAEPRLTGVMQEVSKESKATLEGLRFRTKTSDSFLRKVAGELEEKSLQEALVKANDTVRYTFTIPTAEYTQMVGRISALLQERGYVGSKVLNAWTRYNTKLESRYRGLNTTWIDPLTGVAFEVQFHTPQSALITRATHAMYETFRLPTTPKELRDKLAAWMRSAYGAAEEPADVHRWTAESFPPPPERAEPKPPPNLTGPGAATGLLAPQAAQGEPVTAR